MRLPVYKFLSGSKSFFTTLLILCAACAHAQIPAVEWKKCLGGNDEDFSTAIDQTKDSGYIISGYSRSTSGDVTKNLGSDDYWIVKLKAGGAIEWQKTLGSSYDNQAHAVRQAADGGYIVCGYSGGMDGDVNCNHGMNDIWLTRLSATGSLVWQKCLGGSGDEEVHDIRVTADNGFILVGASYSADGDLAANKGFNDYWIVKLSSTGVVQWKKSYGGSGNDFARCVKQTFDGGYIVAGGSSSADGDAGSNHGELDGWILKLSSTGTIQWKRVLGGSGDESIVAIAQMPDSGYMTIGTTLTMGDGDVSGNHGSFDMWVTSLSPTGTVRWKKCFGGTDQDYGYSITPAATQGSYILSGISRSNNGDVTENHGSFDCWIMKITGSGIIQWQKTYGGTAEDDGVSIKPTFDGGYIVLGNTASNNGDVAGNHGYTDYWVMKLAPDPALSIMELKDRPVITLAPNPASDVVTITGAEHVSVNIYNTLGQVVKQCTGCDAVAIGSLPAGIYTARVFDAVGELVYQEKLVKR